MDKRIRRTQHQVWCDMIDRNEEYTVKDTGWVWYEGKIWKCDCHNYLGEFFLSTPNDKEVVHMDVDQIYEHTYEVFDDELKTLEVLYGKKVL